LRNYEYGFQVAEELAKNIGMRFFKTFAETDESLAPSNPQLRRRGLSKTEALKRFGTQTTIKT
jgi:hypothetical protein